MGPAESIVTRIHSADCTVRELMIRLNQLVIVNVLRSLGLKNLHLEKSL